MNMSKEAILGSLIDIYKQYIEEEQDKIVLNKETKLQDMPINSVSYIKVIIDIENEFDFEFDDDALLPDHFVTIDDMVNYIMEQGSSKEGDPIE